MLAVAILRIIVVANEGQKTGVIDLLENTVSGSMTPEEAHAAISEHLEKFLENAMPLRAAHATPKPLLAAPAPGFLAPGDAWRAAAGTARAEWAGSREHPDLRRQRRLHRRGSCNGR